MIQPNSEKKNFPTLIPSPFTIQHIKNAKLVKTELKPFLHNSVQINTRQLSFENEPHTIETIPLIGELFGQYLFNIRQRTRIIST